MNELDVYDDLRILESFLIFWYDPLEPVMWLTLMNDIPPVKKKFKDCTTFWERFIMMNGGNEDSLGYFFESYGIMQLGVILFGPMDDFVAFLLMVTKLFEATHYYIKNVEARYQNFLYY